MCRRVSSKSWQILAIIWSDAVEMGGSWNLWSLHLSVNSHSIRLAIDAIISCGFMQLFDALRVGDIWGNWLNILFQNFAACNACLRWLQWFHILQDQVYIVHIIQRELIGTWLPKLGVVPTRSLLEKHLCGTHQVLLPKETFLSRITGDWFWCWSEWALEIISRWKSRSGELGRTYCFKDIRLKSPGNWRVSVCFFFNLFEWKSLYW